MSSSVPPPAQHRGPQPTPNQHPYPAQGQYQPTGYYPPQQPPKKKHTLRNILLAVAALLILIIGGCAVLAGGAVKGAADAVNSASNQKHTIVYTATSQGKADVTYNTETGTSQETFTGTWTKKITTTGWDMPTITVSPSIKLDGSDDKSKVTCKITIDGVQKSNNSGSGTANSAICDATT